MSSSVLSGPNVSENVRAPSSASKAASFAVALRMAGGGATARQLARAGDFVGRVDGSIEGAPLDGAGVIRPKRDAFLGDVANHPVRTPAKSNGAVRMNPADRARLFGCRIAEGEDLQSAPPGLGIASPDDIAF